MEEKSNQKTQDEGNEANTILSGAHPLETRQTDKQADRQRVVRKWAFVVRFVLASEADCTVLLLYVDRLTALFSIPSFPSRLFLFSLPLPEGAHGKTELCVYVSVYVDVQRRGKEWDGPVVLFDFSCPSPFRYHYIRGDRDETILVHNHSSFFQFPLCVSSSSFPLFLRS